MDPAELTRILGAEPTKTELRGDTRPSGYVAKLGSWRLSVEDDKQFNLDDQIRGLFAVLTPDVTTWVSLSSRYRGDLFCGLFMQQENEGLDLHSETLTMIGNRGLRLALDIYDPVRSDA